MAGAATYNSPFGFLHLPTMFPPPEFRPFSRFTAAVAVATLLVACSGQVEDTRPGQPVKTRQTAFKELLKSFEPMGVMLRDNRYDPDKFVTMTTTLMSKRDAPWSHFGPDTNYPPTKATAEVWSKPAEFEREKQAFFAATDKLQAAVNSKDQAQVGAAYEAVHDSCKSCHKTFKAR